MLWDFYKIILVAGPKVSAWQKIGLISLGGKKIWKEGAITDSKLKSREHRTEKQKLGFKSSPVASQRCILRQVTWPRCSGRVTHLKCRCDNACENAVFGGCCEQASLIDSQNAGASEDLGEHHYKGMHQVLFNVTSLQHRAECIIKLSKCLSLN